MATILAVDDVEDNIFILRIILESLGHRVVPAYNGKDALAAVEREQIDLILLDFMMPGMSGLEVAEKLKGTKAHRHIPIIMLTAKKSTVEDVTEALNAGAEEYLTKPFKEAELAARVASMLRMKTLYDQVAKAKATMEEELYMAQVMQASLLPSQFPYEDRVGFTSRYEATAAVGGDFFDVLDFGDGKVCIVVADVSGHGPSAALIVAMIKVILFSSLGATPSATEIMLKVNSQLLDLIPPEKFVTMFFGIFDTDEKSFTYIRAGHPYPLLIRSSGRVEALKGAGDIIGMFDDISLEEITLPLESGDRVMGYSDGIVEARDATDNPFGMERFIKLLTNDNTSSPDELLDKVMSEVKSFNSTESLSDDAVLLLMEVK